MVYNQNVDANTVKIIRNNWPNDTIIVVNLRRQGLARLFWANDNEVESKSVSVDCEISSGESVYVVAEERKNLVILNQNNTPQPVYVEIDVNPIPPSFRPISATSGF